MEEAPEGDAPSGELIEYELEVVALFLLESGVPEPAVYGWHEGWDFPRLSRAFEYFKRREVERQRDHTLAIALGASSIVAKEPLEKFLKATEKISPKSEEDVQPPNEMVAELNKMMGMLDG